MLERFLEPGDVFIDVGANIGYYSLLASGLVGRAGRVFSIEAHPAIHTQLLRNVQMAPTNNISAIHAAAAE